MKNTDTCAASRPANGEADLEERLFLGMPTHKRSCSGSRSSCSGSRSSNGAKSTKRSCSGSSYNGAKSTKRS